MFDDHSKAYCFCFNILNSIINMFLSIQFSKILGGDERNRTADPLLARQVLSQLSYTPIGAVSTSAAESVPSKLNNDTLRNSHFVLTIGRYKSYSLLKSP